MNGTVIIICLFFRMDVHCLISYCTFSGGLELQTPHYEEIKFYWYAKDFDKNNIISCFDIDLDDLDYNEDDKLILCFDFR